MDENDVDGKSPMKRVGSTRKILDFNTIQQQFTEQLRCLDCRVESQVAIIQELQDFYRRRGELEMEYSKSLDKLSRSVLLKHKEQKQKRMIWPLFSTFSWWKHIVNEAQLLSKDHAALSDLYAVNIVSRLQAIAEDVQRIYQKCRRIAYDIQEEIFRIFHELYTTMNTYQKYENDIKGAENKLMTVEAQQLKLKQTISKEKLDNSKKYKLIEKEVQKRKNKYMDIKLKALRAKLEYELNLEAANSTIHKYFVEDLSDIIDCMDFGFGSMISRTIFTHISADQKRSNLIQSQAECMSHLAQSVDTRADKQKFLEQHHTAFMVPKRLDLQNKLNNSTTISDLQQELCLDMEQRLKAILQRLTCLRIEADENWKTLEVTENKLLENIGERKYNCGEGANLTVEPTTFDNEVRNNENKQEIEDFYLAKIHEYLKGTSRIARLNAKADFLKKCTDLCTDDSFRSTTCRDLLVSKRKRIGHVNKFKQTKLFGESLEDYLESSGEDVPLIVRSCVRVINLYGLQHQGIFRVSGSQVEINNFREAFERGEDPLADTNDASDINSVAGVLKLYLRELREPLFPFIYFDNFMSIAEIRSKNEIVVEIKNYLQRIPRNIVIVIRFLFAFLHHLSEFSDANMMDAYNLAVCFGPTLMRVPEDKDQVQYQNQINELIKTMIIFHNEIFAEDLGGLQYEDYISQDQTMDPYSDESQLDVPAEDVDSEKYSSEDELEATVLFDFNARSMRELSLQKGDTVILKKQVSNDWWHGILNGQEGLIPNKYISLKTRNEERVKVILDEMCEKIKLENGKSQTSESVKFSENNTTQSPFKSDPYLDSKTEQNCSEHSNASTSIRSSCDTLDVFETTV
ncbi:SLIT-ROBO Rho GTPase-activating protein 1-like isoform X2 [Teleopsis dalmanni]|nr:SLIT-ROBO Rho GTPase-activating protein 1-like isoform X2 [Teleopsis dalmanni]